MARAAELLTMCLFHRRLGARLIAVIRGIFSISLRTVGFGQPLFHFRSFLEGSAEGSLSRQHAPAISPDRGRTSMALKGP